MLKGYASAGEEVIKREAQFKSEHETLASCEAAAEEKQRGGGLEIGPTGWKNV